MRSFIFGFLALVGVVVAAPGLKVALSSELPPPSRFARRQAPFAVSSSITNSGDEDLVVVQEGSLFENVNPTESFIITNSAGVRVPFVAPTHNKRSFTLIKIKVGETITVTHSNLAEIYDFSGFESDVFTFQAPTGFQVANAGGPVTHLDDTIAILPDEVPTPISGFIAI